jgi:Protein of unknown function (DUF3703)
MNIKLPIMKIYTAMPIGLKPSYNHELARARFFRKINIANCWHHLERAHVIGQSYPLPHTIVHWEMLKFGFKIKSTKEILGQLPRLLFGGVKSFVGTVPTGNTGGSNVSPLKPMPIPADIQDLFNKYKK